MKKNLSTIWDYISSNKFAVILICLTALVSLFGTVIPQKQAHEVYLKAYGEVFSGAFYFLRLNDLYGSLFFKLVLILLGLSLTACNINRLISILKGKFDLYALGSLLAHLSTLIIYVGAIYGGMAGFSTDINIEKGTDYFEHRNGVSIRLNDFNARFDVNGRPLDFTSDLSVIKDKKEALRKTISVNNPLEYDGIKYYQSSYGINAVLQITGPSGKTESIPIYKGSCATYSPTNLMFCIDEIYPDLNVIHSLRTDVFEPTRPIIFLATHVENDHADIGWLVAGKQLNWKGYSFRLINAKEYTGLQVRKDPGIPIVYAGFLFLTVGVMMMLYFRRKT